MTRSLIWKLAVSLLAVALLATGGWVLYRTYAPRTVPAKREPIPITAQDRVLIIAPHPDDETLGPGLFARRAVKSGAKVKVVIVTAGDAGKRAAEAEQKKLELTPEDYMKLGETRHKESLSAMRLLGVKDVVFLGFADGSTNSLWRQDWDTPHLGANGRTAVPYRFAYKPGAEYTGKSLARYLGKIIKDFNPTVIIYPAPEDMHHDHWAVNAFVQFALAKNDLKPREYTYLVHHGLLWPMPPVFSPKRPLNPPAGLSEIDADWDKWKVDAEAERLKLKAVNKYKSQTAVNGVWLRSFVRTNELFAVYPPEQTVKAGLTPSFKEGARLPGVVRTDYESSVLSEQMGGAGDIESYSFVCNKKHVYVAVQLKKPLAPEVVMMVNMVFFGKHKVNRVSAGVQNGKIINGAGAEIVQNSSLLVLKFPVSVMDKAKVMMFNVDTFADTQTEDKWLDRAPWTRIALR